jgi:hypothetical protein
MIEHSESQATELKDKVNALLGISQDFRVSALQPDYNKSLREVYGEVVRLALQSGCFFSFCVSGLSHRQQGNSTSELPSWMSELGSTLASAPYHNGQYIAGTGATGQPAEFRMSEDLNQLSLRGLCLDTIVSTSDGDILEPIEVTKVSFRSLNITDAWDFAVKAQRRIADMCSLFELRLPEIQQRYKDSNPGEVFWQTITDNFRDKGVPKQEELAQTPGNFEEFVSSVIEQPSADKTRSVEDFFAIFSPANEIGQKMLVCYKPWSSLLQQFARIYSPSPK